MIGFLASIRAGVKTLTDRLTATRAGYLDNLDAAISTRLGSIRSVQRGTIAITLDASGIGSNTATISSVTTAKSIVTSLGASSATTSRDNCVRIELTNGTTVTANGNGPLSGTLTVGYQVVEFN